MRRQNGTRYTSGSSVLTAWRDYLGECGELGVDIEKDSVLFPNNLYDAHTNTSSRIKIKTDASLNIKIAKRLKDLRKYTFEHSGFLLRPVKDSIELFQEGKALHHCVGGYAGRYAAGTTNIFVIRKSSEPDTPFYTMEVIIEKNVAQITQCYGFKHCNPTPEVKAFVEAFTTNKLLTKKRTRIDVTGIRNGNRQEAVV
jgi:hypothetical protein